MENILHSAFDSEAFRQQGHALVDLLANHLAGVKQAHNLSKVIPWQSPEDQLNYWQTDFEKPTSTDPIPLLEDILQKSIHLHHPRYMGHQVAPPLPLGALTSLLTGLLNNGMALYEMGQVSSTLEKIVTDWLGEQIGFPKESSGILTSGGTLANLTALLAARSAKAPGDVWEEGYKGKLAIMVSEEAHYCVDRAARIMGLGSEGIIKIPTDDSYQMRTDLLELYYQEAKAKGITVFAVVGSACTTSTGSYDNLVAIADFCAQHQCWFHVDGAHGGAVVVSDVLKSKVNGMERAHSVVIDFHKMLMMPALVTAVIFRQEADSYRTFQQKAQYLWSNQQSQEWFNLGKRTFECTKVMMSVKVYTALRTYGQALFATNVENLYSLASHMAHLLQSRSVFELSTEPAANIVCFRYIGDHNQPGLYNIINSQIRQKIVQEGRFYVVQTKLRGNVYLRVSLMNPLTTITHLVELLDEIEQHGQQLTAQMG